MDKKEPLYVSGPSEFLYLIKNAFLICTDSFHGAIFSIIYKNPFIVFERQDKLQNMNSRMDTLLNKFKLEDRIYNGKIESWHLQIDYKDTYKMLEKERERANKYIKKILMY